MTPIIGGNGPFVSNLDFVDIHHKHIARLGTFDINGTGCGIGESVRIVQIGHRGLLVGNTIAEAVFGDELEHLARLCRSARRIVLGKCVNLLFNDLHVFPFRASAIDYRPCSLRYAAAFRMS